jgi:hypothetical protein
MVVLYERDAPGKLLHVDTKRLGLVVRPSRRVTGDRKDSVDGAGWEFAYVAVDDHSLASFMQIFLDERKRSLVELLKAAVAHYEALCVMIKRLSTDKWSDHRSDHYFDVPSPGNQAPVHQAIPTSHQRQGRAVHTDVPARMGLRPHLGRHR